MVKKLKVEFYTSRLVFPITLGVRIHQNKFQLSNLIGRTPSGSPTLYKGNFGKYKGKFWKSVFWNFKTLNLFTSCLMALVCIPEVLTHLLTPILAYLVMRKVKCQMRNLCQKCQKCYIWRICHLTYVIYRYGNMGVKRCVRTSGMQTNAIKQLVNRFNVLKFQNTDFQNFPLYFSKFPLYNEGTQRESFQLS